VIRVREIAWSVIVMLAFLFTMVEFGNAAAPASGGPPRVLEIRAICNSPEVQALQTARARKIPISYWWDVSQSARKGAPGFVVASGLRANVGISGIENAESFHGKQLRVTDRNGATLPFTVAVTKVSANSILMENASLGDGITNIHLEGIQWIGNTGMLPLVEVQPIGWTGTGISYNGEGVFAAFFGHRLNNSAIMPEIRVQGCGSP